MSAWAPYRMNSSATSFLEGAVDRIAFTSIRHTCSIATAIRAVGCNELVPWSTKSAAGAGQRALLATTFSPATTGQVLQPVGLNCDFLSLLSGRRAYWLGSEPGDRPICRFLISAEDHSGRFDPYDPSLGDGPWWHAQAEGFHYANLYCQIEFLFDEVIGLDHLIRLEFGNGAGGFGSVDWGRERHERSDVADAENAAVFLSHAVSTGMGLHSVADSFVHHDGQPTALLLDAFEHLTAEVLSIGTCEGYLRSDDDRGLAVATALCAALAGRQSGAVSSLVSLFRNSTACIGSLAIVIAEAVDLPDSSLLERRCRPSRKVFAPLLPALPGLWTGSVSPAPSSARHDQHQ